MICFLSRWRVKGVNLGLAKLAQSEGPGNWKEATREMEKALGMVYIPRGSNERMLI
jgi:aryl carrier-like protein